MTFVPLRDVSVKLNSAELFPKLVLARAEGRPIFRTVLLH